MPIALAAADVELIFTIYRVGKLLYVYIYLVSNLWSLYKINENFDMNSILIPISKYLGQICINFFYIFLDLYRKKQILLILSVQFINEWLPTLS